MMAGNRQKPVASIQIQNNILETQQTDLILFEMVNFFQIWRENTFVRSLI
jgi:hypothetical protein